MKRGSFKNRKEKRNRERRRERTTATTCGVGTVEIAGCMWWPTVEQVLALGST